MSESKYEGCNNVLWPDIHGTGWCKCCKTCGSTPSQHELRNYNMAWHDGDVYCNKCGAYVRMWDAG